MTVFEPNISGLDTTTLWSILGLVVAMGIMLWGLVPGLKGIPKTYKPLVSLLGFIGVLVAAITLFFSSWAGHKIGPVQIDQMSIETPYGKANYRDIRRIYLEKDQGQGVFPARNSESATQLLIIEEITGKTHVLSSENYPVMEIITAIRDQMPNKEKEKGD